MSEYKMISCATRSCFDEAVERARADFLEMPGLKLTCAQARRLWALDLDLCRDVLTALVDSRFLVCTSNASFMRAS